MAVKDIIAALHKGVSEKLDSPQKYFHKIIKPIEKANLDEIEIYRAVAEHCEENDIDPAKMVDDVICLFEELPRNIFFIKTSERFYYMRKSVNEIKRNQFTDKQFICNSCHYIHPIRNKVGSSKLCKECHKKASQESYERNKAKPKPDTTAEIPEQVFTPQPAQPELPAAATPEIKEVAAMVESKPEFGQFLTMSDLMTDPATKKVTLLLECDFHDLKNLLEIIDPYLVKETKEGDQNAKEAECEDIN